MKTSLHKHSFRTVGLALAIGLGLAAASHSAQASIVQITLGADNGFKYSLSGQAVGYTQLDVTLDGTPDSVYLWRYEVYEVGLFNAQSLAGSYEIAIAQYYGESLQSAKSSAKTFTFQDARINGGSLTTGYAQGVGVVDSNNNVFTVTLTRVVFDNASTSVPTFDANTTYPDAFPSSTAVPEPGTFIPAAVLVAGALLRRRRSRSHRGGRATA